jgi:hypothetical protein
MNKWQLQNRVRELEMELLEAKAQSKPMETKVEKLSFITETRKIKTFSGRPESKTDVSVDDWIDDIEMAFSARKYTNSQKVDLIYSHLEGQAKDEIKFRTDIRQDPEAMLECLRSAFGNPETVTILQQKFFERHQKNSESIRQYSYALQELFQNIIRKDRHLFPNKDLTLCEKFVSGLCDSFLRKEAKRLLRKNPTDFYTFRDEIITLSEEKEFAEQKQSAVTDKAANTISDQGSLNTQPSVVAPCTDQLLKIIEAQQKQIDSLAGLIRNNDRS